MAYQGDAFTIEADDGLESATKDPMIGYTISEGDQVAVTQQGPIQYWSLS